MDERLRSIVARLLAAEPASSRPVEGGYTHNVRRVVTLADGRTAFVKAAVDELSAEWLRSEHRAYSALSSAPFLPRLLGWADDGKRPVLVLEDLSGAVWPPPWTHEYVEAVLTALRQVAATPPPRGLPSLEEEREELSGWRTVEREPGPFLGIGLCTPAWLAKALPVFRAAEEACVLDGSSLLHLDVRSDNICFLGDQAMLVDWNHAAVGNPELDVAAWLPSLHAEGGPAPDAVIAAAPEAAAFWCGFFAARAGLSPPATAPHARDVQLAQLRSALPWAARALGLPSPVDHVP